MSLCVTRVWQAKQYCAVCMAGREYDKSGVLQPWWKAESISRFNDSAQCFVDQYTSYTAYGEHVSLQTILLGAPQALYRSAATCTEAMSILKFQIISYNFFSQWHHVAVSWIMKMHIHEQAEWRGSIGRKKIVGGVTRLKNGIYATLILPEIILILTLKSVSKLAWLFFCRKPKSVPHTSFKTCEYRLVDQLTFWL